MKRVLVVEDCPHIQTLLRIFLEKEGLYVDVTDNVIAATCLAKTNPYDLYIVDILLPGELDGSVLIGSNLRPMIVTSALDLRLETVKFLRKPFTRKDFIEAVNKYIN
jgi:DNA-binding response OmpR family regulator